MAYINFKRGKYKDCQNDNKQDSVYFASDANTIMMNGNEYGSYPKNFSFLSDADKTVLKFMPNQSETSYIDFPTATQTQCGVMSKEDKTILDTLSEGNNDYGTY